MKKTCGWLFVAVLLLANCAKEADVIPLSVEPDYKLFVSKANEYNAPIRDRAVQIYFVGTPRNEVAQCEKSESLAIIRIDPKIWNTSCEYKKQMILFHELGHCLLDREHTGEKDEEGHPKSIMHSFGVTATHFKEKHEDYLAELFTNK